jgi:hypothetical protein
MDEGRNQCDQNPKSDRLDQNYEATILLTTKDTLAAREIMSRFRTSESEKSKDMTCKPQW